MRLSFSFPVLFHFLSETNLGSTTNWPSEKKKMKEGQSVEQDLFRFSCLFFLISRQFFSYIEDD